MTAAVLRCSLLQVQCRPRKLQIPNGRGSFAESTCVQDRYLIDFQDGPARLFGMRIVSFWNLSIDPAKAP